MNAGRTDEDAMAATAREARRSGGAARGRVAVVLIGTSLVLAYATLAVVQILVLNPHTGLHAGLGVFGAAGRGDSGVLRSELRGWDVLGRYLLHRRR